MSFQRTIAVAVVAVALAACTTGYQRMGLTGGYAENQLDPSTWHVKFLGNGFTSPETVQTFWLYRCATLTLEKGHQGFEIMTPMAFNWMRIAPGSIAVRTGGGGGFAGAISASLPDVLGQMAGNAAAARSPTMEGDIHMVDQPFTATPGKVFDALALKTLLEPLVTGKQCGGNVCPHPHTYLGTVNSTNPTQGTPNSTQATPN